jgi:tripartite-type tricarboxylate transporter receptor subunit TctC
MGFMRQAVRFGLAAAWLAVASLAPAQAQAPAYPDNLIRMIVPYPPAGGTDIISRELTDRIAAQSGWKFVIDNRPGSGGNIGMDALAKSKPDGYTLAMGQTSNLAINPTLFPKMPYDALKDVAPVALVAAQAVVVVVAADSPIRTLADLVAAAKAKPNGLNMATAGVGTVGHLGGELFARRAGIRITSVPYKGAGPALTDLIGGQTDFMLPTPQAAIPLIKGGRVRALAVTGSKRMPVLPDVATVAELGYPGFDVTDWKVLVAPAGTPAAIVNRINAEVDKSLAKPEMVARLLADGSAPMGGSPQKAAQFIAQENARWGTIIRDAKIKPE